MKKIWPKKSIQALFLEAKEKGQVSVSLPTPQDAELFRFALYNAKRRNKQLNSKEFQSLRIDLDGTKITIFKPIETKVEKVEKPTLSKLQHLPYED